MAFFDQLSAKLTQTSQTAVQKTKDMAEIVRLSGQIAEEEKKIEQLYREIGETYYRQFADKDEVLFRDPVKKIRDAEAAVAAMRENVRQLKGVQVCPACGKEQPNGIAYCSSCGVKMPEIEAPQPPIDGVACPACGAVMERGMAFCTACGAKLPSEMTQPDMAGGEETTHSDGC